MGHEAHYAFFERSTRFRARALPRGVLHDRAVAAFQEVCTLAKPSLSVEVGANEASFTRWAAGEFGVPRSVAFEANPYVYDIFHERVAATGAEYLNLAVGPTNGTMPLTIPTKVRGVDRTLRGPMASLRRHLHATEGVTVDVPVVRLDDYLATADDERVVAWIDVEGASQAVLEGGVETLRKCAAVFIEVEAEPTWEGQWLDMEVACFLGDLGLTPVLRDTQRPHQYNVVFVDRILAADPVVARLATRIYRPVPKD